MNRILSAVQPTGNLHLGNYLGAIKNWTSLQNKYQSFFCIVDLHALTIQNHLNKIKNYIIEIAAIYLSSGINPNKSTIFVQSSIPEHTQLTWLLSCQTPMGWLNKMIQFKEKAKKNKNPNLGIYSYPVLMAADILLYKATHIPVGEDQKQHIELSIKIAENFNRKYNIKFFPIPKHKIIGNGTRIMNLRDATKKMSKSEISDLSRINILDKNDTIAMKIKKAKTTSEMFPNKIEEINQNHEINNLINIYSSLTKKDKIKISTEYYSKNFSTFKKDLTEIIINFIAPIRERTQQILKEKKEIEKILNKGNNEAKMIAKKNLQDINRIIGI